MGTNNTLPSTLTRNTRNTVLYADAISSVWSWWDLIADPSYALREDLDIWEVAQRDPKVYQGIQQRLNAIAGRKWKVMPRNSSKHPAARLKASIVDAMLRRIPHFADARKRLAQAVFKGQSAELICGRREFLKLADKPAMYWWVCTGMENIDHRRFVIRPIREKRQDGTTKIRGQLYMSVVPTYQSMPSALRQDAGPHPSGRTREQQRGREGLWYSRYLPVDHPEWFVRIVYDDEESRLGFGRGIMDAIYFTLWVKSIVLREGLQGLERFVHGVPIVTLDPSKRGATDQTSEQMRDAALASIHKMRKGHAFALNAGETLIWAEPGSTGHQMVMGFLEYLDRNLMAVITGSNLRSGGDPGNTGSYASDTVGQETSDDIVQYDRDKVDEDLSQDLIGLLCKLNRPQFQALGDILKMPSLADEPDPVFTTVVKRPLDPLVVMQIVQGATQIKDFDLNKDEVYEQLSGFSMPDDDADVFKGGSAIPEQPAVDPATGMPLPPGMPNPESQEDIEAQEEQDWPDGLPEDNDEMFGPGTPEDDDSLFLQGGGDDIAGGPVDSEEVVSEEAFPERDMVDGEPGEQPVGAPPAKKQAEAEVGGDESDITVPKATPDAPAADITVKVKSGGPSKNVEIEGMDEQRKKARE